MAEYICPVCRQKIPRDLTVFLNHANQHIIQAVKKEHPDWVEKDGLCPKCTEYYERAKKGEEFSFRRKR
ncbi:MAG: hypothetical protein NC930_09560 [Candidatus Omnitrophica bacterium]|nr:hypothetical protein [Candidatus Omnitrophota bacterium]